MNIMTDSALPSLEIPPSLERLMLRSIAMPAHTNPSGNIFGGWLLSQMDLAGANAGTRRSGGPVVTAAIESIVFHEPVNVGDEVSSYAEVIHVGRTSMKVQVDVWIRSNRVGKPRRVAEGKFVFVAIDEHKKPRPIEATTA